jgi:hypothetical protein
MQCSQHCAALGGDADVGRDEVAVHGELRTEVEQLKLELARLGMSEISCFLSLLYPFRASPVSVRSLVD